jgi:hypothetical protein
MTEDVMRPEPRAARNLHGREDSIRAGRCLNCQHTYTRQQINMWPDATQQEYTVCGLCRTCQAAVFGEDRNRCTCDRPCCEADVGVGVITCGDQHCWVHGATDPEAVAAKLADGDGWTAEDMEPPW